MTLLSWAAPTAAGIDDITGLGCAGLILIVAIVIAIVIVTVISIFNVIAVVIVIVIVAVILLSLVWAGLGSGLGGTDSRRR